MSLGCCQRELEDPDVLQKVVLELWETEIGAHGYARCTKWTYEPMGHILMLMGGLWGTSKGTG